MGQLKRIIAIFLVSLIVIHNDVQAMWINNTCEFVKETKIVDKKIKEDFRYLMIDVEIPQISGLKNEEGEKVINNKIMQFTEVWISEIRDLSKEYFGPPLDAVPIYPYQVMARYNVERDSNILSFYIDYYQYTGGAHGITNRVTYNIDTDTGKELSLGDLFVDDYNFEEVINKEIYKQIDFNTQNYFQGSAGFNGINKNQQFFLNNSSLVIQFQHYEIAPYSSGMPEFRIPLRLFKENFIYGKI